MGASGLVAGIDSSTQSTKAAIVEVETGRVVALGRAGHDVHGVAGARESDPERWWQALGEALAATGLAGEVDAISVAGQQHGLCVLDGAGRPLRPALLWNDVRSAPDAAALVERQGAPWWAEAVGSVPVAAFTVAKWAYVVRTEPALAASARAVRLPHDLLTERLAGVPVTDRGDASGTGWSDARSGGYREDVLALPGVGLDPALLPTVLAPDAPAGAVTAAAAAAFGLRAGIPVACGTGDNMAAALALGLAPGQPVISLGTSGTAYAAASAPPCDPSGVVAGFADAAGGWLPLACTLNCTLAVDRVAAWLGLDREAVAPAGEVVVLPFLDGERTPNLPAASGVVVGLRHDTPSGAILQAAYDGAAAALLDALDRFADAGAPVDPAAPLVVIGGGARGAAWRETLARLSGRALALPQAEELVALGAAVQAAAVAGGEHPRAVAARWALAGPVAVEAREPDQARRARIADVLARAGGLLEA